MVNNPASSLDRVLQALAHPARRAMLHQLTGGECNLTALASPLKMSFPAASKHVRVLEKACLVHRRVVGRTHLCHLEVKAMSLVTEWLENFHKLWAANFDRLDQVLEELKSHEKQDPAKRSQIPKTNKKKTENK